mmetsp:Transcript_90103/g.183731  ORF Transcript_90103/g.183731 Transcript_90103/m.183731 type:complete len:751 (+) Transcript_90103:265-2517(+)
MGGAKRADDDDDDKDDDLLIEIRPAETESLTDDSETSDGSAALDPIHPPEEEKVLPSPSSLGGSGKSVVTGIGNVNVNVQSRSDFSRGDDVVANDFNYNNCDENDATQPRTGLGGCKYFLDVEETIGCILDKFDCSLGFMNGILYAGPLGVVFASRLLVFEWTVFLRWEEIETVGRKDSAGGRLRIETKTGDLFDFEGFLDPHATLWFLRNLRNESILGEIGNDNDDDDDDDNDGGGAYAGGSEDATPKEWITPAKQTNSDPPRLLLNFFDFDDLPVGLGMTGAGAEDLRKQCYYGRSPRRNQGNGDSGGARLDQKWAAVRKESDAYPEAPVVDRKLVVPEDADLEAFVEAFVGDNAPSSYCGFMTEVVGDSGVTATRWVADDNDNSAVQALARTIEYTHPVNAPMAPPQAQARKEQTMRNYGNNRGLVIETKTIVSDVPMTDCFYVRDVLLVERNTEENGGGWLVNIRFEIVFVKSTMFRSLISRTTTGEFNAFMKDLAAFLVTNCGGTAAASTLPAEEEPTGDNNPALLRQGTTDASHGDGTPSGSGRDYATLGWKLVSVVLLVWIATAQGQIWNETRLLRDELKTWKDSLPEIWDETGSHLDEFLLPEIRNEARTLRDRLVHAFNVSRPEPVVQAPPPMEVPVDTPMDIPRPTAQGGFSFLLDVAAGALFLWGSFFLMVFGGSFLSSIKNLDERSDDTHAPKTTTTNLRPKLEESSPSPFSSLTSPSSIARGQLLPIGSDENTTTAS